MKRFGGMAAAALVLALSAGVSSAAEAKREFVQMVSQFRAGAGLGPVAVSRKLEQAAAKHADDMARRGFFSHTGSDGSSVGKRAKRVGYRYCRIVENIAKGQASSADVMRDWAKSPGHRQNMLDPKVKEIGVAKGAGNTWVMVIATKLREC